MLKFKKQKLIFVAFLISCLLILSLLVPLSRTPLLNILRLPFLALTLLKREIRGLVFYHRNMAENEILEKQIDLLKNKVFAAEEAYRENKRLKDLLSLKQNAPYKVIASRVIASSSDNWSAAIIIDKGSWHGIKRGFVAVGYLGLIGRVAETSATTSKIILINDPSLSVSAIVQRSRQPGLVSGSLSGSLIMRYLPPDSDIKISDTIITSGLTALYPKGIIIGKVSAVGKEFSGLSRYAIIKAAVNLAHLEEVLVIIP